VIGVDFNMFIDRPNVARRVDKKKLAILAKTGGYGRQVLRSLLNKPLRKGRKGETPVTGTNGETYFVDERGRVRDANGRFLPREAAAAIKADALKKTKIYRGSKPGEPPRRITGLIRKLTFFGIDKDTDTVVIAPQKFAKSDALDVLNEGGRERLLMPGGKRVTATYEPRPFIEPVRPTVEDKFREQIESVPL
jgi:hypothetical protein